MTADRFRLVRTLSLVGIVLVAATGFCLVDGASGDHGAAGLDLCLGMIATTSGALFSVNLHDAGRPPVIRRWTSTPATIGVLDPPPWTRLSV
jgi:hypothetical protein